MTDQDPLYAPPETGMTPLMQNHSGYFYVVSPTKFTLLFFFTTSAYLLYWFYAHWRAWKISTGGRQLPVLRGLFNIFFTYSLFRHIRERLVARQIAYNWSPALLALIYIVFKLSDIFIDFLSQAGGTLYLGMLNIVSLLLLPLIYFPVLIAQKAANMAEGDPEGSSNSRLTWLNLLWILLGGLIWLLILGGVLADILGLD